MLIGTSVALDLPPFFDLAASVGSALLIGWLISRPQFGGRLAKVSIALGALSYPLYLWHVQIIDLVDRPSSWGGAFLALAITAGIGVVSYLAVERPAIRFSHQLAGFRWRLSGGRPMDPALTPLPEDPR